MNCNNNRSTILLNIYSYDCKQVNGTLYSPESNTTFAFRNLTQLLLCIDNLINTSENSTMTKEAVFDLARRQIRPGIGRKKVATTVYDSTLAEFRLDIYFKRFGAWQGEMTCLDSGRTGAFRSVIELALMLDCELEAILSSSDSKVVEA